LDSSKGNSVDLRKFDTARAEQEMMQAAGESGSKKTYRRADIIDLMVRNPERYAALSDEIMAAYAQGRVK